jgi:hypothetical protein
MTLALDLTPDERKELTALLRLIAVSPTTPDPSLHALVKRWSGLVSSVERGYEASIYDYTNDLTVRDSLQNVVLESSESLRSKVKGILEPLDERFREATEPAAQPLSSNEGLFEWWYRVPKMRRGEFADDLVSLGYIR